MNYPRSGISGPRRFLPPWRWVVGVGLGLVILVGGALVALVYLFPVPQPNDVAVAETTKVLYADGKKEIGRLGSVRRTNVSLDEVPEHVQHAVLAAEDQGFYDHGGFSFEAIGRALWNNLTGGDTQGGSTITQQYVKNAYLTHDQTFVRKAKELILSIKLETSESKHQILEDYLNTIYFGRGAYGIEAASEAYYDKTTKRMTVNEGIALAALIRSPGNYEPKDYPHALETRMGAVSAAMVTREWITPRRADKVELPKVRAKARGNQLAGQTGYLLEAVRREMTEVGWSEAELEGGGLTIVTTIDKKAQDAAVDAVRTAGPTYNDEGVRIGLAAVVPGTGEIRAIYGGEDYIEDQLDNAMQARAQAGSTFKPFALAAAIEQGYSLSSVWNGASPATISGYTLQNYGNTSFGPVSLLRATQHSINTAYVAVESAVGVRKTMEVARRAGLPKSTPGIEENLTFVLGTASPRPIDMAASFATFASGGIQAPPTILSEVRRSGGETAYRIADRGHRKFDEDTVMTLNTALQAVVNSGTATRASWIGRPAAGKTGTEDSSHSAWFVGYTPQLAAAVMLAKEDDDGNQVTLSGTGGVENVTGGSFPTAIWAEFVRGALEGEPALPFPGTPEPPPPAPTPVWTPPPSTPTGPAAPAPEESQDKDSTDGADDKGKQDGADDEAGKKDAAGGGSPKAKSKASSAASTKPSSPPKKADPQPSRKPAPKPDAKTPAKRTTPGQKSNGSNK